MYRYVIRHPRRIIVLGVVATICVSPGMLRLRLRTDGNALVPAGAPEIEYDRKFRDFWDIQDQTIVVIDTDTPDGIYNPSTLRTLLSLADRLAGIEGLKTPDVTSLATEKSDRVWPGTLDFRDILDPFPGTEARLDRLRSDIAAYRVFTGTLVASDASAFAILIATPRDQDRKKFHYAVQKGIEQIGPVAERIYIAGAPIAESQLGTHILEDLLGSHVLRAMAHLGITEPVGESFGPNARTRISLIVIALAVMALVFYVTFRSFLAMALPLLEVAACLIFTFSLMGWCHVPVYLTIAVIPVILTAIGVADELHIFTRYRRALQDDPGGEHPRQLELTMAEMWRPVTKTSITSAIGFLSFGLSPIAPVRAFGLFMAVGIGFCMVWSLTVVPASLALINPQRFVSRASRDLVGPTHLMRIGSAVLNRRYLLLAIAGVAVLLSPLGIDRLVIQDSWVDAFSPASAMRRAMDDVNRKFFGAHLLLIELDTGPVTAGGSLAREDISDLTVKLDRDAVDDALFLASHNLTVLGSVEIKRIFGTDRADAAPVTVKLRHQSKIVRVECEGDKVVLHVEPVNGSILSRFEGRNVEAWEFLINPPLKRLYLPAIIEEVGALESFIRQRGDLAVGGVLGLHEHIATTNYLLYARNEEHRRTPDNSRRIERCLERYEQVRGKHRLRRLIDRDGRRCTITVFLKNANFVSTKALISTIREYERNRLAPLGIRLHFAGDVAVSQAMIAAIVRTQTQSLLLSLVGIVTVTSLLCRSVTWGILSTLPAALAVLMNFAMMGLTQMPLGVATSMFSGMTIGIGVDYAIHFLERAKLGAARQTGWNDTIIDAVSHAGPAILVDGIAIALGFGVLLLSPVPANRRLGGLVMVAVTTCLVATFVVLPALIRVLRPRFLNVRSQS